jgi:hypothetical protein
VEILVIGSLGGAAAVALIVYMLSRTKVQGYAVAEDGERRATMAVSVISGATIGAALSLVLNINIGLGVPIGVAIGVAIGSAREHGQDRR